MRAQPLIIVAEIHTMQSMDLRPEAIRARRAAMEAEHADEYDLDDAVHLRQSAWYDERQGRWRASRHGCADRAEGSPMRRCTIGEDGGWCDACREACEAYDAEMARLRSGRSSKRLPSPPRPHDAVDGSAAMAAVDALLAEGWSASKIGREAGLAPSTVTQAIRTRRPNQRLARSTVDALLRIELPDGVAAGSPGA